MDILIFGKALVQLARPKVKCFCWNGYAVATELPCAGHIGCTFEEIAGDLNDGAVLWLLQE